MNEATKLKIIACLWSLLRLVLNAVSGYLYGRPEAWAKELSYGIVAITGTWTVIDNGTTVSDKAKEVSKNIGLFLLIAFVATGCASTPQEKIVRFAEVSKSVAFEGASLWLVEKPQHKATLQLVVDQLSISIQAKQFTPARLVAILKPLDIRELASKEGRIAIGATVLVWDGLRLTGVIGDTSNLAPVFEGLRDGFQSAIDTTK